MLIMNSYSYACVCMCALSQPAHASREHKHPKRTCTRNLLTSSSKKMCPSEMLKGNGKLFFLNRNKPRNEEVKQTMALYNCIFFTCKQIFFEKG